jgi:hypothetical protein
MTPRHFFVHFPLHFHRVPGRAHIFAITVIQARISMKIIGIVIGARGKRVFSGCRL